MHISKSTVLALASEGRLTLQIPDYVFTLPNQNYNPTDIISVPDDLFCRIRDDLPAVGKGSGFLYLTRKGFNYFYNDLQQAFNNALAQGIDRTNGLGWSAFVQEANDHFNRIDTKRNKKVVELYKKIQEYHNFIV